MCMKTLKNICMLKKTFLYFRLRPIYYHSLTPYILDTKPEFVNTLDEVRNSRAKYQANVIGQLTSEVERLQSHLVRNPWQVFLWSFIFDQQIYEGQNN